MQLIIRAIFAIGLVIINIIGVKAAGRLNDVLTIIKLTLLFLIRLLGTVSILIYPNLTRNYSPIAHRALNNFGIALALVFWAYAGFELITLPTSEVAKPKKNIARAMIGGMAIVIFFYVMINVAAYGAVNWADLSKRHAPLILVNTVILDTVGGF